jgi:hypothetical protein
MFLYRLLQKIVILPFRCGLSIVTLLRKHIVDKPRSTKTERRIPRLHFGAERAKDGKETFKKGILKTEQIRTLEVMPDDVKILYTQVLAAQALADNHLDSKEFSDLYVFMAQIGLDAAARDQVRKSLVSQDVDMIAMVDQVISKVKPDEQNVIRFSIIKDLLRVSRMDGQISSKEIKNIRAIAAHLYQGEEHAGQIITFAEKAIEYDEKLLMGKLTVEEFTKGAKNLAATAASIGVPITAVYFSGSVIGLSAAGIISGLTQLGLGGILGFSSLVTGIGVVVIMGVVTFKLVKWAITGKERQMEKIREHMVQEIIKLNQKAMISLAEDINSFASHMEKLAMTSEENRKMLAKLHELYQDAMNILQERKVTYREKSF